MWNPFRRRREAASDVLPDWQITCGPANPNWQVRLGNCDEAHAESVLAQLRDDASVPDDLNLEKVR